MSQTSSPLSHPGGAFYKFKLKDTYLDHGASRQSGVSKATRHASWFKLFFFRAASYGIPQTYLTAPDLCSQAVFDVISEEFKRMQVIKLTLSQTQILDSSKMKEFADNNFKFDESTNQFLSVRFDLFEKHFQTGFG